MELSQLEQFRVLAETENMHTASKRLFITQPALSHSLAKLEGEIGCTLFDRLKQRIKLNDNGRAALESVERIFREVDTLRALGAPKSSRSIRIQSDDSTCLPFFRMVLSDAHPNDSFTCSHAPLDSALASLGKGGCDIVICNQVVRDSRYFTTYVCTDRVFVSLPGQEATEYDDRFDLADLAGRSIIYTDAEGYLIPLVLRAIRRQGVQPEKMESLDFTQFILAVLSSDDVHFVSLQTFNARLEEGRRILPLVNPSITADYYAVCREDDAPGFLSFFATLQKRYWDMEPGPDNKRLIEMQEMAERTAEESLEP